MWILLRLIGWQYARKHLLRTVLTSAGVVLGVAVLVGMHTANETVLLAFSKTIDRIAGKTELQISAGDAGFDEEILEKVQSARSVRIAVPAIEAIVESNLSGQGSLMILGIDMTGDRGLRDYDLEQGDEAEIDDPLIFLAQPDSLILAKSFAQRNRLEVGSRLTLGTAEGPKTFVVRGLMKSESGLASAFSGNMAVMDIYAAQKMFGRGRTFDRIDLAMQPGTTLVECQRELRGLLGPAFEIQPPSGRGQQFETMLAGYSLMMDMASGFALFIGMFIIYNAFAIAVSQRRTEIGILRALGATQRQIRNLFLCEGAVLGLVGSVAGVASGMLAARSIAAWIGRLLSSVYGVAQRADELATDPKTLLLALGLGLATSVIAAILPARDAARLDPVHALQKGSAQAYSTSENRLRVWAAAALATLAAGSLIFSSSRLVFYLGYASAIGAALLAGPLCSRLLSSALRPLLQWLRPVEGALAADSLIQAPRRTSGSVAALMLSVALVVAFSGMGQASYQSIDDWMNTTLDPDLFVMPSPNLDVQTTRFPSTMGPELAALPGVSRVQTLRNTRVTFRDTPIMVVAIETGSLEKTAHLPPVQGDERQMYRLAAEGKGVLVSDTLALLQGLRLGEQLEIAAPHGTLSLPIVGIVIDYSDQQGAVILDRSVFLKYWHDDTVNAYRVYTTGDRAAIRQRILDQYAGQRQVFVLTNEELKQYISRIAGQWFSLTSVQIAVAVLVAILGIVNTLTVSITDRRKELGVLRAVGALHAQIKHTIWIEAMSIAAIGLTLGIGLGSVNLFYVLEMVKRDIAGMRLNYQLPVGTILTLVPVMLGAGLLAALWPARAAVRGSLVEALEYE
ncbi:MAG: FtsX-like permease family protein [Vicinamibacterales bacterium]